MTTGSPSSRPRAASATRAPSGAARTARIVLLVVLGLWLVIPVAQLGTVGQDAIPLVAAGQLVRDDPGAIYTTPTSSSHDTNPTFRAKACGLFPGDVDCDPLVVPYSPPPIALPVAFALGALGATPGTFLLRLVGALALAYGFLAMARRFDPREHRSAIALTGAAVALTPYVWFTLRFGQTVPLLFLSAALGVATTEVRRATAVGRSALLAATIALKAFPLAVVVIAVVQRRWRLLAGTLAWLAVLTVLTLTIAPISTFSSFLQSTQGGSSVATDDPYNRGVDGLLDVLVDWRTSGPAYVLSIAVRIGIVGLLWVRKVRHLDDDAQWSWGWAVLLLLSPVVWLHYQWLVVAAVAHALRTRRVRNDPAILLLPMLAAVLSLLAVRNTPDATILLAASTVLVVCVLGAPFLARPAAGERPAPRQSVPAR